MEYIPELRDRGSTCKVFIHLLPSGKIVKLDSETWDSRQIGKYFCSICLIFIGEWQELRKFPTPIIAHISCKMLVMFYKTEENFATPVTCSLHDLWELLSLFRSSTGWIYIYIYLWETLKSHYVWSTCRALVRHGKDETNRDLYNCLCSVWLRS